MTPEEKRLDKYYQRKFGWTLEEVNKMFAEQNNVCAACHRPPGERRMSVDHDHALDRIKITFDKGPWNEWHALFNLNGVNRIAGATKKEAKTLAKQALRRRSVRGGLCLRCNKGLAMFEDSKAPLSPPERLDNLAVYLRKFQLKAQS